jgi:integrase
MGLTNRVVECTKNGKPSFRIDYVGADGERHQAYRATREAADDVLAKAITESRQPIESALPSDITLGDYFDYWMPHAAQHLKPRTVASYTQTWDMHLKPKFGGTRVRDLQRGKIKAFLATKLATHARNSTRIMHSTLRVVLNAAIDDEVIKSNPAAGLGKSLKLVVKTKVRQETIKALDRAQRDTFLTTAARVEPWWAAMWEVQTLSGVRPGEVYALEEADLDLDAGTARINRTLADDGKSVGTPKGNRGRTVDLSARTVQVLRAHLTARKALKLKHGWTEMPTPLFCSQAGTHPDPRNVRDAFARVIKKAKLPHVTPHGLRHTYASLLLTAGTDVYYVSRMLGHASIQETADTYGRWLPANRPGALDVLDAPALATADAPTGTAL